MTRRGLRASLALLLVAQSTLPLLAWKTKYTSIDGPHGPLAERAVELVRVWTGRAQEWDRFVKVLVDSCGTYTNDGNAHGNALVAEERKEPDGKDPSFTTEGMTFNGGPMYRWFVRALEAHGQVDQGLPLRYDRQEGQAVVSMDCWKRTMGIGARTPAHVYRYLGFMVHLAQDNSSPAHMANVRHGPWDGVEWWHWRGTSPLLIGGRGVNEAVSAADLRNNYASFLDQQKQYSHSSIGEYWKKDSVIDNKRGADSDSWDCKPIRNLLQNLIFQNRSFVMPGVDSDVLARNRNYFEKLGDSNRPGGRWVDDAQAHAIWNHEADRPSGIREKLGSGPDFALPLFGTGPSGQMNLAPAGTNGIRLGGGIFPFNRYPTVPSTRWQELNRMKTPWIPNPAYKGEGFDTRWGSYGGHWGFPGRLPIEGDVAGWDVFWSIREPGIGRITPGDIYTVHHPVSDYDDRSTFVPDERNKWDVSSPLAKQAIPGGGYELGQELLNRAALWSAILMESFSQSLPPVISRFTLNPRKVSGQPFSINQNSREGFDQRVLPWIAGTLGGQLSIRLDMNRSDDYFFEIYAIPRSQFASSADWKRSIFFWSNQSPTTRAHTLWPSDLAVTENTGAGGGLPSNYPTRNEDYAYSKIKGYPLVLSRGFRSVRENNFLNSDASQILPWPISIPASTLSFQTISDTANPDRYPYYKEAELDWTGEVRDPIQVLDQDGNPGGPSLSSEVPPVLDIQGKKLLPSGEYFLFLVAYRRDQRFAFARNQYKFLTPSKEVLEYFEWWAPGQHWTNEFVDSAIANHHARSGGSRPNLMIPDELCPIRLDTKRPTAVVQ